MPFRNSFFALLLVLIADIANAQIYQPPAPGYLFQQQIRHWAIQGNYPTPQASWDACVQTLRFFSRAQAEIDYECGKAASTNMNTYSHDDGGYYNIRLTDGTLQHYYLSIWYCPQSEQWEYFEKENKCVHLTKLGPRPTPKDNGMPCQQPTCGNPVVIGRGTKVQIEKDFEDKGPGNLSVFRTYNGGIYGVVPEITVGFGAQWTFMAYRRLIMQTTVPQYTCYQRDDTKIVFCRQQPSADGSITISAVRPDGKIFAFTKGLNGWGSDSDVSERLAPIFAADGSTVHEWVLSNQAGDREHYDANGTLLSIQRASGGTHRYTYSDGTTNDSSVNRTPLSSPVCGNTQSGRTVGAGRILCITDDWGRQLNFEYDLMDRVSKIITPNGEHYHYAYDGASGGCAVYSADNKACSAGNLTSVTYPDGKSRLYHYNERSLINKGSACANVPGAGTGLLPFLNTLTGLTDENNVRYASWGYSCTRQVTSSEHAGGIERVTLSYGARAADGSHTVTVASNMGTASNPTTLARSYDFFVLLGTQKNKSVDKRCNGCGDFASRSYDTRGNVTSSKDWNGKLIEYFYEPVRNLEIKRIEAKGSIVERTISTVWHPVFSLPIQVWEPKRVTTYEYDDNRNLLTRTEQATTDLTGTYGADAVRTGVARAWSYSYNTAGQLLTVIGPRKDIADVTNYTYDDRGNLETVTNALNQVTRYSNYDGNGRMGKVIAPNGLTTEILYNSRGLVSSRAVTDGAETETTRFEYDGVGQLTKVTLADDSYMIYTYDPAHRLTNVADSAGNSITYTLDLVGNRVGEHVSGHDGVLTRKISRVFDTLNNLIQVTGGTQ